MNSTHEEEMKFFAGEFQKMAMRLETANGKDELDRIGRDVIELGRLLKDRAYLMKQDEVRS